MSDHDGPPHPHFHRVQPHNRSMIPGSTGPSHSGATGVKLTTCCRPRPLLSSPWTDGNTPPLARDGTETSWCGRIGPVPIIHKSPEVVRREEVSRRLSPPPPFTRRGKARALSPSADRVAFPTWGHRHCHPHLSFLLFSVITSQKLSRCF